MKQQYKIANPQIIEIESCLFHSEIFIEGINTHDCSNQCLNFKISEDHETCLNYFIDMQQTNDMIECSVLKDGTIHISFDELNQVPCDKYIELSWFGFQKHPIAPNDINGVVYTPYRLERGEYIP